MKKDKSRFVTTRQMILCTAVAAAFMFSGCGDDTTKSETNSSEVTTRAFFGDKENNRVVIADVDTMELSTPYEAYTGHQITYTADKVVGKPKAYVVNRGSDAIDVIDINTHKITKTIPLTHHPRSAEAMNETLGLCETTGMDKEAASIIDINTDEVVAVVGDDQTPVDTSNNPNHGGSHATGHPFWLDTHHFVLPARYSRTLTTYHIQKESNGDWNVTKLNTLDTPTSLHQIIPRKGNYQGEKDLFYATAEGDDTTPPAIIEYKLTPGVGLEQTREVNLTKEGVSLTDMSLHHGDFHPTQKLIYVGSAEGTLFIVNYDTMTIEKMLQAGKGAGHTFMVKKKHKAIVINHKDIFVTVIDTETNEKIKDVNVSFASDLVGSTTIQAHPKFHVSEDGQLFHAFLTEEGIMYEMDMDKLKVTRSLWVGGKPAQGAFIKYPK